MTRDQIFENIFNAYLQFKNKEDFLEVVESILDINYNEDKQAQKIKNKLKDDIHIEGDNKEVIFQNDKLLTYLKFRHFNN